MRPEIAATRDPSARPTPRRWAYLGCARCCLITAGRLAATSGRARPRWGRSPRVGGAATLLPIARPKATMRLNEQSRGRDHESSDEGGQTRKQHEVASSFGAAGALIVLLLWVYYSAQIFLLGAEFTKVYANWHGSTQGAPVSENPPCGQPEDQEGVSYRSSSARSC